MQILLILLICLHFAIHIESIPHYFRVDDHIGIYTEKKGNDIRYSSKNRNSNGVAYYEEWIEDYPEAHISNLLQIFPGIAEIFSTLSDFENSSGDEIKIDRMDFCESEKLTIKPRVFENIDKVQKLIVNLDWAIQKISLIICTGVEGGKCSYSEKLSVASSCKQSYSKIRLLTFNATINELEWDYFNVPCGCICVWK